MAIGAVARLASSVATLADDLFTSDEERLKLRIQEQQIAADIAQGQMAVNAAEAQHKSLFVAGWRPAVGWIGAAALAYQFLLYPLLVWVWHLLQTAGVIPADALYPPVLPDETLWVILSGMLGIGGMRSFDKSKGKSTERIK